MKTVGSITKSSPQLCKAMIKPIDFQRSKYLLELGAGDGVITQFILQEMREDATLFVFELNAEFCKILEKIDDDRLIVINDSAENLEKNLKKLGCEKVDSVISAIPFTILPEKMVRNILLQCYRLMKTGSILTQVHYNVFQKKRYNEIFGNLKLRFVAINVPPAFVYVSMKNPEKKSLKQNDTVYSQSS